MTTLAQLFNQPVFFDSIFLQNGAHLYSGNYGGLSFTNFKVAAEIIRTDYNPPDVAYWYSDEQKYGGDLIMVGIMQNQPNLIYQGIAMIAAWLYYQNPDGSFQYIPTYQGGFTTVTRLKASNNVVTPTASYFDNNPFHGPDLNMGFNLKALVMLSQSSYAAEFSDALNPNLEGSILSRTIQAAYWLFCGTNKLTGDTTFHRAADGNNLYDPSASNTGASEGEKDYLSTWRPYCHRRWLMTLNCLCIYQMTGDPFWMSRAQERLREALTYQIAGNAHLQPGWAVTLQQSAAPGSYVLNVTNAPLLGTAATIGFADPDNSTFELCNIASINGSVVTLGGGTVPDTSAGYCFAGNTYYPTDSVSVPGQGALTQNQYTGPVPSQQTNYFHAAGTGIYLAHRVQINRGNGQCTVQNWKLYPYAGIPAGSLAIWNDEWDGPIGGPLTYSLQNEIINCGGIMPEIGNSAVNYWYDVSYMCASLLFMCEAYVLLAQWDSTNAATLLAQIGNLGAFLLQLFNPNTGLVYGWAADAASRDGFGSQPSSSGALKNLDQRMVVQAFGLSGYLTSNTALSNMAIMAAYAQNWYNATSASGSSVTAPFTGSGGSSNAGFVGTSSTSVPVGGH
jgi:hypothetical protein